MPARPIVAIDGPSGAGKSTVAKLVAERLGYLHLDTGAMYRAVALAASRAGVRYDDESRLDALCGRLTIDLVRTTDGLRTMLDGHDVSEAIRTPEMSAGSSAVSSVPAVRRHMVRLQRRIARDGGVVAEGRDMGTVVFPSARSKYYLDASPEARAQRRWQELAARGIETPYDEVLSAMLQRDHSDSTRADSPLSMASDARLLDTTGMTAEEVAQTIQREVLSLEAHGA